MNNRFFIEIDCKAHIIKMTTSYIGVVIFIIGVYILYSNYKMLIRQCLFYWVTVSLLVMFIYSLTIIRN